MKSIQWDFHCFPIGTCSDYHDVHDDDEDDEWMKVKWSQHDLLICNVSKWGNEKVGDLVDLIVIIEQVKFKIFFFHSQLKRS